MIYAKYSQGYVHLFNKNTYCPILYVLGSWYIGGKKYMVPSLIQFIVGGWLFIYLFICLINVCSTRLPSCTMVKKTGQVLNSRSTYSVEGH